MGPGEVREQDEREVGRVEKGRGLTDEGWSVCLCIRVRPCSHLAGTCVFSLIQSQVGVSKFVWSHLALKCVCVSLNRSDPVSLHNKWMSFNCLKHTEVANKLRFSVWDLLTSSGYDAHCNWLNTPPLCSKKSLIRASVCLALGFLVKTIIHLFYSNAVGDYCTFSLDATKMENSVLNDCKNMYEELNLRYMTENIVMNIKFHFCN